jgi:hypothetical protein
MPVIEIVEFTTHPDVQAAELEQALTDLDAELHALGGLQSRTLFHVADAEHAWILDYRWDTLAQAQTSMPKVAGTPVFGHLMSLVANPETMRMTYGLPA